MARRASATCPAVKEECPLTSWKLTASSLACLKAGRAGLLSCRHHASSSVFLQASDPRDSAVHGVGTSLIVESDVDLGRLVSLPQESVSTRRSFSEKFVAPLFEFSTRLAEHRVLCLLLEYGPIANHHSRGQGAMCNQLKTMEQFTQAAFAGFQLGFQDHASEVWTQSTADVLDDANTLLDPSVALNEQN